MATLTCHESLQPICRSLTEGTNMACQSSVAPQRSAEWSPSIAPTRWQVLLLGFFFFPWCQWANLWPSPGPTSMLPFITNVMRYPSWGNSANQGISLGYEVPWDIHTAPGNSSITWKQQLRCFSICAILNQFLRCRESLMSLTPPTAPYVHLGSVSPSFRRCK